MTDIDSLLAQNDAEFSDQTQPLSHFSEVPLTSEATGGGLPASACLSEQHLTEEWLARAEWLEQEASHVERPEDKARMLVLASELWATSGNLAHARDLARTAAELDAPTAWTQVHQLALADRDLATLAQTLDHEARRSTDDGAAAHAAAFAAELERLQTGNPATALHHLGQCAKRRPNDPRPLVFKLARQLSTSKRAPDIKWPEVEELTPLKDACDELSTLRGASGEGKLASPVVALLGAQKALLEGKREEVVEALSPLFEDEQLAKASLWLAAAVLAPHSTARDYAVNLLRQLREEAPSNAVERALFIRGVEQHTDLPAAPQLSRQPGLSDEERLALLALIGAADEVILTQAQGAAEGATGGSLLAWAALSQRSSRCDFAVSSSPEVDAQLRLASHLALASHPSELDAELDARCEALGPQPLLSLLLLDRNQRKGNHAAVAAGLTELRTGEDDRGPRSYVAALIAEQHEDREQALAYYREALSSPQTGEPALRAAAELAPSEQQSEGVRRVASQVSGLHREFLMAEAALNAWRRRRGDPETSGQYELFGDDLREMIESMNDPEPGLPLWRYLSTRVALSQMTPSDATAHLKLNAEGAFGPRQRALCWTRLALLNPSSDEHQDWLRKAIEATSGDPSLWDLHWGQETPLELFGRELEELSTHSTTEMERARLNLMAAWAYEALENPEEAARLAHTANRLEPGNLSQWTFERCAPTTEYRAVLREQWLTALSTTESGRLRAELARSLAELAATDGKDEQQLDWLREAFTAAPDELSTLLALEQLTLQQKRYSDLTNVELRLAQRLPPEQGGAHAELAARLLRQQRGWPSAFAALKKAQLDNASLGLLRQIQAHSRHAEDYQRLLDVNLQLSNRPCHADDRAALLLRAAECALRLEQDADALEFVTAATEANPRHVIAHNLRATLLERQEDYSAAAVAKEMVAKESRVVSHRVTAWYEAGCLWLDHVGDPALGQRALTEAFNLDSNHPSVFQRLLQLHEQREDVQQVRSLLQRRLTRTHSSQERHQLQERLNQLD